MLNLDDTSVCCLQEVAIATRNFSILKEPPADPGPDDDLPMEAQEKEGGTSGGVPVAITAAASVIGALILVLLISAVILLKAKRHRRRVDVDGASTQVLYSRLSLERSPCTAACCSTQLYCKSIHIFR